MSNEGGAVNLRPMIERSVPLIDISVNSNGDGRTVTAYAATFDEPYPVSDMHGQYDEIINRAAFNKTLSHGIERVQVIYNHGMTLYATPSERYSMPLGVPLDIKAEKRGLLTVTRYAQTPLADEVLELIRSGAIRAQSFRGAAHASAPPVMRGGRRLIRRLELGLKEYGPSPFATNIGAEVLAVRSSLLEQLEDLDDETLAALRHRLGFDPGTGDTPPADKTDPTDPPPAPAPVDPGASVEIMEAQLAALRARHNSKETDQ